MRRLFLPFFEWFLVALSTLHSPTALSTYKLNQLGVTHVVNVAQAPTISMYPPSDTLKHSKWQDWGAVGGFVRTSEVPISISNFCEFFHQFVLYDWTRPITGTSGWNSWAFRPTTPSPLTCRATFTSRPVSLTKPFDPEVI